MKMLIICLTILVCGCGAQPHIPTYGYSNNPANVGKPDYIFVWVDKSFNTADHTSIKDAVATWNKTLNGFLELKVIDLSVPKSHPEMPRDKDWVITKVKPGSDFLVKAKAGHVTIGTADFVGGHNIFLAREAMNAEDVYYVSLHEMGHLLGANHRGTKLMYPNFDRVRFHCIDYLTSRQIADANNLPGRSMNYCTHY